MIERDLSQEIATDSELHAIEPLGPMDVSTRDQADAYVRKLRVTSQSNIRPMDAAVAWASMDVATALYAIRPTAHTEYTTRQKVKASKAIELIFEARDEILPTKLGHQGREEDKWADDVSAVIRLLKKSRQRGGNVTAFRSRKPQVERGSMEMGQAVEL